VKILLITTSPGPGGVWTHVVDLYRELEDRGHDVRIGLGRDAERLAVDAAGKRLRWMYLADAMREQADIVHFHLHRTYDLRAMLLHLWRAATSRSAVVLTEHLPRVPASDSSMEWDPALPHGRKKPGARHVKTALKRLQFWTAHSVITVSRHSREFLLTRYRLTGSAVTTIVNGVHLPDPPAPVAAGRPMQVVCVGALVWRKGFDVLIDAAKVSSEPWEVTIYGEGYLLADLEERAGGLGERVKFAGWTGDGPAVARNFDVVCVPSRSEAFPYTSLEAMALGRAVVASDVDGLPEVVNDRVTGLLVPPGDSKALAAALDELSVDRDRLPAYGFAGRSRIADEFSVETMVGRTLAEYDRARRACNA
jgi:glycosyltransferase involved in cell wall biosynthesis